MDGHIRACPWCDGFCAAEDLGEWEGMQVCRHCRQLELDPSEGEEVLAE
jgi:hypothetical protein